MANLPENEGVDVNSPPLRPAIRGEILRVENTAI
jgi:hypothetical protein